MRIDLSNRLASVAWARLEHAYGSATDLPALLEQISGAEPSDTVVKMLRARLVHQGWTVYSAAVEAVPILVDLVIEGRFPARAAVVGLIGDIAREAARVGPNNAAKILWSRMWAEKLTLMAGLLEDSEVEVRRLAPSSMASAELCQNGLLDRLLEVAVAEEDEPAQLGQLVAVADLLPAADASMRQEVVSRVARIVEDGSPQLRMAGALVMHQVAGVDIGMFVDALCAADVERWRQTWCISGERQSILLWVDNRLADLPTLRLSLGKGLLASADVVTRADALRVLMRVASRWRSSTGEVSAAASKALNDSDESVVRRATFILAVSRTREPEHIDRLAEIAAGRDGYSRQVAVWGLARMGDSRCVPHLLTSLRLGVEYPFHQVYQAVDSPLVLPSLDEVLLDASQWSGRLLLEVIRRLAKSNDVLERRSLVRAIAGWGPKAKFALPVLVDGLASADPSLEIIALAAIGARVPSVPVQLVQVALQRVSALQSFDRTEILRAYTQITGDLGPVLAELPDANSDEPLTDAAVYLIGALGLAGVNYAARLEQLLGGLSRSATFGAARSHWEITGEPEPGGQALVGLLADLDTGRPATATDLRAIRQLIETGVSHPVLTRVSRFLLEADVRVTSPALGWRGIDLDLRLAASGRHVLNAESGTALA